MNSRFNFNTASNALVGAMGTFFIIWAVLGLTAFGISVYGLYLAFSASILLGVVVFFVQPAPLVLGLVMLLADKNLSQMIMDCLSK